MRHLLVFYEDNSINSRNNLESDTFSWKYFNSVISACKRNGVVTLSYAGDASGFPTGDMGSLFVLPEKYRPCGLVRSMTFPNTDIQITIDSDGSVTARNYGSAYSDSVSSRFLMTYVAAS